MADEGAGGSFAVFIAVYYPCDGPARNVLGDAYTLTGDELRTLRQQMPGVAITYNHVGMANALWRAMINQSDIKADIVKAEFKKSTRPEESVLGEVIDAWAGPDGAQWCSFKLHGGEYSGVGEMVKNGLLRGVSLTHYRQAPVVPLELSLCKTPARPQCSVRHIARSPLNFQRYKGLVLSGAIPSAMATLAPTPAETQGADKALSIIKTLPEDEQQLLRAAFNGMNDQLNNAVLASKEKEEAAAKKLAEVEAQYKTQIEQAGIDSTILSAELRGFQETLGAVLQNRPELAKIVSCKELADNCLSGMSHQQMNGMNALVTCASKAVMMLQDQIATNSRAEAATTVQSGSKRARIEDNGAAADAGPAETAIIEPTAPNAKMTLREALARTFER